MAENKLSRSKTKTKTLPKKNLTFLYATRSFLGHLEGTQKAAHTISSYKSDLASFEMFLNKRNKVPKGVKFAAHIQNSALQKLTAKDLDAYAEFLQAEGQKTNTRRRKLLTVRRLLRYLEKRNRMSTPLSHRLPAPHKMERVPATVECTQLIESIKQLPTDTPLLARNRLMPWTLAETGCQVSEIANIHQQSVQLTPDSQFSSLEFHGRSTRKTPISHALGQELLSLPRHDSGRLFIGHNKHGPLSSPITSRGIELLVRAYADRLGFPSLTPRTFRHSAVLGWFKKGHTRLEIQTFLGLRTQYSFRVYEPLLKSLTQGEVV